MTRLLAAIALFLLSAFSAAADTTLQVSLLHYPAFTTLPGDEPVVNPHLWNLGDEPARDVVLTFTLPPGSQFTGEKTPPDAYYEVRFNDVKIGTDRTGTQPRPNGSRGVAVVSPIAGLSVGGSVISMNARSGIYIWDAQRAYIAENSIIGNGASGIFARPPFEVH